MATAEERRKILEMVAEGKLSVSQGAQLLQEDASVAKSAPEEEEPVTPPVVKREPVAEKMDVGRMRWDSESGPNWLHIRVDDHDSGRSKVQVNIPLGLLKFGAKLGRELVPELSKADWELLRSSLQSGEGVLVDVENERQGERVQVYLG